MDYSDNNLLKSYPIVVVIFILAFIVRMIHNGFIMDCPLYDFPLGGHLSLLILAEKIAGGDIIPIDIPFSINSPLYPYIVAGEYLIVGVNNFLGVRIFGILVDSLTCVLVSILAKRHFGIKAGIISGIIAACYGPMIFYSTELVAVPYTLFFITLGIFLLEKNSNWWLYLISGFSLGLAVATRPNLLLLVFLIIPLPFVIQSLNKWKKSLAILVGVTISIFPITFINYQVSGKFILLTTSAGHNFYIGHNPQAKAGYYVPDNVAGDIFNTKGDIFNNMKRLAEKVENRRFDDSEVSSYYFQKSFKYIISSPLSEGKLLLERIILGINNFEYTTYSDYSFQKERSMVLKIALSMGLIFPFSVLGMMMAFRRRHYVLFTPIIASFMTTLLFFHISRLRMPMTPFLSLFAAHGILSLIRFIKERTLIRMIKGFILIILFFILCYIPLIKHNSSNEWNKVGVIYRVRKNYPEAEKAFLRAIKENPVNPNSYFNLSVLYRNMGDFANASKMLKKGNRLINQEGEREYINKTEEIGIL